MVTLRHCRHRQDGRGTNFPPRWRDPPTTDRTVDARNHELRCGVSSRRRGRWNWVSRTALDLGRGERAKHVPRSRSDVARQARPAGTRWPGHPLSDAIKDPSLRYGAEIFGPLTPSLVVWRRRRSHALSVLPVIWIEALGRRPQDKAIQALTERWPNRRALAISGIGMASVCWQTASKLHGSHKPPGK